VRVPHLSVVVEAENPASGVDRSRTGRLSSSNDGDDECEHGELLTRSTRAAASCRWEPTKVAACLDLKVHRALERKAQRTPTWRASCRCFTTDSLPQGYRGSIVRASAYAELDGKRKRQSIYPGLGPRS